MQTRVLASTVDQLCQFLNGEEAACGQLLDTVQDERTAIRKLEINRFHGINCRRLSIIELLQTLADSRERLVQQLAESQGLSPETSLHQLVDHLQSTSNDLQRCYQRYMERAKTVRAEIKHNATLIEGIRSVIDQALSTRTAGESGQDLYSADGQAIAAGRMNILIHQQG